MRIQTNHSFIAFVDESGSEGDPEKPGGSEFLIVSAAVLRITNLQFIYDVWEKARVAAGKPPTWRWPSFKEISSDPHKFLISRIVAATPVTIATVAAHKPTLTKLTKRNEFGDLYFYLSQLLLERISWICRDGFPEVPVGDGTPRIIFSDRAHLSMRKFGDYARLIRDGQSFQPSRAAWDFIDVENIHSRKHSSSDGLRLADFIASSFGRAMEYKQFSITDSRFVEQFRRRLYRSNGRTWRNGLKLFPPECEEALLQEDRMGWVRQYMTT